MNNTKIQLITGRWSKNNLSIARTATKLVNSLLPLTQYLECITTNHHIPINSKINQTEISHNFGKNIISYYISIIYHEIAVTTKMIKNHNTKYIIFCFGADLFICPILVAKIYKKRVIIRADGRPSHFMLAMEQSKIKIQVITLIEKLVYSCVDQIVLEHPYMLKYFHYEQYQKKIAAIPLYVDMTQFKNTKKITTRSYDIAYIGRFSPEKGIIEFISALTLLPPKIKVLIIGGGPLQNEIIWPTQCDLTYIPWLEHEMMPNYLNEIKILVMPSYKEGLSNLLIEAMACGTPTLATPVGAVLGIIKDGETGFIMKNNSPICISENIIRGLSSQNLNKISENCENMVKKNFTFENTVEEWRKILKT